MRKFRFILYLALFIYATCPIKTKNTQADLVSSTTIDTRVKRLEAFFQRYESDLEHNASAFIEVADRYGLDYRLMPAIAGAESTFGKFTPSCAGYNPFGYTSTTSPCGYYRFENYDQAIRFVAEKIGSHPYYHDFRDTGQIKDLSGAYNNGNEAWIQAVNYFMEELN